MNSTQVLSLLTKEQKKTALLLIIIMFISSFMEIFNLSILIVIINFLLDSESTSSNFMFLNSISDYFNSKNINLNYILYLFLTIFIIKIFILIYASLREAKFVADFKQNISNSLFNDFLGRDAHKILKKNSSIYLRNFTTEIDLTASFYRSLMQIILDFVIILALLPFLFFFDFISAMAALTVLICFSLIYYFVIKDLITNWAKKRSISQKKKVQFVNEGFSAIKYIKMLARESYFLKKFKEQTSTLSNISFKVSFVNSLPKHVLELFLFSSIILTLVILFYFNYSSDDIIKIISVYVVASLRIVPSTNRILGNLQGCKFTYPAFKNIYNEFENEKLKISKFYKKFAFNREVKVNIKSFKYNQTNKFHLKGVKLKFRKKQKIGIIGPSGSGKSTIIDIICGFIKDDNINITADEKSVYENLSSWQKNIGYIPQKIIILNSSLKKNILFGVNNTTVDNAKLNKVIKKVKLEKFVKKLPNGINETMSQDGLNISGGEMQRIGIARALINDPELIIIDEATNALDSITENQILKEINSLNKTVIFVSHRINTLKYCDKIYYLKRGKLKDAGNYKNFLI